MKKALFLTLVFVLLLSAGVFVFLEIMPVREARAGAEDNVFGWAWSENIGWLSFNCTDRGTCGNVNYGVNIGLNGVFSGYAWSAQGPAANPEGIGWISFNTSELSGCPLGACEARVDLFTGDISGWARACSVFADHDACSGALDPERGGWDGWLKLRGTYGPGTYGPEVNFATPKPREFTGWAWGGDDTASSSVIGWLSFNCNNPETGDVCATSSYKVQTTFNFPPWASSLKVEPKNHCTVVPVQYFTWDFEDPEEDPEEPAGDTQGAYRLQVDKEGNWVFGPGEFDSRRVNSPSEARQVPMSKNPAADNLLYNTHYYWRLTVWDNWDTTSTDWIYGPEFDTERHIYPRPNFTWFPSSPAKGEVVRYCSTLDPPCSNEDPDVLSKCYDNNNLLIYCDNPANSDETFRWTFPPGTTFSAGTSATSSNPRVKFDTAGDKVISLNITDDIGSCSITKGLGVTIPLPIWKEISP